MPGPGLCVSTVPICAVVHSVGSASENDDWSPCAVRAACAAVCVSVTTLGTTTWHTPDEVTSSMYVPDFTSVPDGGRVPSTSPDATVFEHFDVVVELTVRPCDTSVDVAATGVCPPVDGTGYVVVGARIDSVTVSPVLALAPAMGFCWMTVPGGCVEVEDVRYATW